MPTAAEKAKAKLEAVLNNPNRNDASSYNRRVMTTTTPLSGSNMCNGVTRRESTTSQTSADGTTTTTVRRKSWIKDWMNRPAF
ncbi:hypothetical protein EDB81DRAFT_877009 [Dactylonectria macrodidyma]|uniref:Uncharacterized protein n=1 Tax=Dactylonectria macrodidyma TaxID=307937 RepID=A0A9P9FP89_9HYPO|nr:hypothetical protein EDB81DRAFT_877009 [Dactylonectria macrodidyma]